MTTTIRRIKSIKHNTQAEVYTSMDYITLLLEDVDIFNQSEKRIAIKLILNETNIFELIEALQQAALEQGFKDLNTV